MNGDTNKMTSCTTKQRLTPFQGTTNRTQNTEQRTENREQTQSVMVVYLIKCMVGSPVGHNANNKPGLPITANIYSNTYTIYMILAMVGR